MNQQADQTEYLELLYALLHSDMVSDDAMTMSELDGFIAGVISSPEPILPAAWVPEVWGKAGLSVDDEEELESLNGVVTTRFRHVLFDVYQGFIHPLYNYNEDDEVDWAEWANGFGRAMAMQPDGWDKVGEEGGVGGIDAKEGVETLKKLCAHAKLPADEREEAESMGDKMLLMAPDLFAEAVLLLYGAKQEAGISIPVSMRNVEIHSARTEPCACGSGKTYEECCLPNDQAKRMEEAKQTEGVPD
ncbi:UPF0149 family protein [Magnetovibrio sp. PR-2]|uniref:UPF0149 family protein n=1 Tax=Magnetovibrio sp. PR-2 TaxID=3120356 RepID=UPI002FCE499E